MEQRDLLERFTRANELRPAVLAARQSHWDAQKSSGEAGASEKKSQQLLNGAIERQAALESGRGARLASIGQATLYEFWIDLPGYSGPVRGMTARMTQHGDIHQVSDVQGKTKGGLGGALVGGALLGPAGAIVGAVASRKTTVKTDVRQVDTRQFELELVGPGFAWSTIQGPNAAGSLQQFRDFTNARGTSTDDVKALAAAQAAYVDTLRSDSQNAAFACQSAASAVEECKAAYDGAWSEYAAARLPLGDEVRAQWALSDTFGRAAVVFLVFGLFMVWIVWLTVGLATGNSNAVSQAGGMVAVHLIAVIVLAWLYVYRVRLVRPSQTGASQMPAAWHPDPVGRYTHRYWDGTQWTEHVANNGVAARDPVE